MEYDVLLGLGYVCGYNLIGIISVVVVIVLLEMFEEIGGEVVVFGMLVEEGGLNGSVKLSYVKVGLFKDIDVVFMIYLSGKIVIMSFLLVVDLFDFYFYGKIVYVVVLFEEGINVLDVVI